MKKLKMVSRGSITLEEGCNKYLDNCRARNLREGTIGHYRQTYVQFKKFFDMQMLVSDIDESVYQRYVVFLRETLHNDDTIKIIKMDGEPQYTNREGVVTHIDDAGQIHGTWGGCAVIPEIAT